MDAHSKMLLDMTLLCISKVDPALVRRACQAPLFEIFWGFVYTTIVFIKQCLQYVLCYLLSLQNMGYYMCEGGIKTNVIPQEFTVPRLHPPTPF